jgi:hypothetical protein
MYSFISKFALMKLIFCNRTIADVSASFNNFKSMQIQHSIYFQQFNLHSFYINFNFLISLSLVYNLYILQIIVHCYFIQLLSLRPPLLNCYNLYYIKYMLISCLKFLLFVYAYFVLLRYKFALCLLKY